MCTLCTQRIKRSAPMFQCITCKPQPSICLPCARSLPTSQVSTSTTSAIHATRTPKLVQPRLTPKIVLPPVSLAPTGPLLPLPGPFPPIAPLSGLPAPPILPCITPSLPPLLTLLRRIPDMPTLTTLLFPPQKLAHKFSEHYVNALWKFCDSATSLSALRSDQVQASLFAKWLPLILLHVPATSDTSNTTSKIRTCLKLRLQMADLGQWQQLTLDLLEAEQLARQSELAHESSRSCTPSELNKFAAVCKKVQGNCLRSAAQILTGAGQPPANQGTFDAVSNLFVCADNPDAEGPFAQECDKFDGFSSGWAPSLRQLTRRVTNLRNGAQPGPSKCRNTHLKLCLKAQWGPQTLQEWSRLWCTGKIPMHMAAPFLHGWVAPLSKPGGKGIRPIALFECSLKMATGLLMEHCTPDVARIVSPHQFGIGMPAGAEVMLKTLQAIALAFPTMAFGSSDVKNAFGTLFRSAALQACAKHMPSLLPAMTQMWRGGPTPMHAQCSPSEWKTFFVRDGIFQGECLSTAIFCLVLHDAIEDFFMQLGSDLAPLVFLFAYVDDVVIVFPPEHAHVVWSTWESVLRHRGLLLEPTKCHSWIPSATRITPLLDSVVQQDLRGLPLLGSAAEGEFESMLGPFALHSTPILKRLDNATALTNALLRMCTVVLDCPSRQCIWILLSRLLCHRLDFDSRVLSFATLESYAGMLDHLVDTVASRFFPDVPLLHIRPQLSLPGHLGGTFLLPAHDVALCAPLASFLQTYPIIRNTLRLMKLEAAVQHIDNRPALASVALLAARGADPSTILQHPVDVLNPGSVSLSKAHGRLIGFFAERRLHTILTAASPLDAARILSCGGPGNAEWCRSPSATLQEGFTDAHFLIAMRWRLGLRAIPADIVSCRHQYVKPPFRECAHPFDHTGHHSVVCNVGGGPTIFLHNPIADLVATFLTTAGFDARREVSIPEFTTQKIDTSAPSGVCLVDGIVDVLGWHVVLGEFLLDVTVRHPHAVSVAKKAATVAGSAAAHGERDKHVRYPPRGGRSIVPLAIETFGRLGTEFDEWLMTLSSAARARDRNSGLSGCRHLSKWRAALSTALYKGIAKTIEDSYTLCRSPAHPAAFLSSAAVIS